MHTRGISFIGCLEEAEKPLQAETLCAVLTAFPVGRVLMTWKRRNALMKKLGPFDATTLMIAVTVLALLSVAETVHEDNNYVRVAVS